MRASDAPRLAAFLRGINLGRRRVKMADLRAHFEEMELGNVESFIASGNVVFDDPGTDLTGLESRIERHLEEALGFATEVFLRGMPDLARLAGVARSAGAADVAGSAGSAGSVDAAGSEVSPGPIEEGIKPHVIFLRETAGEGTARRLDTLETPDDRFHLLGREIIWLRRGGLSDSPISTRDLETALGGMGSTMRSLKTVRRMVEKFGEA